MFSRFNDSRFLAGEENFPIRESPHRTFHWVFALGFRIEPLLANQYPIPLIAFGADEPRMTFSVIRFDEDETAFPAAICPEEPY